MDWFTILFVAIVAVICLHGLFLAMRAIQTGETVYAFHYRYRRDTRPAMFWWLTIKRLMVPMLLLGGVIFVLKNAGAAWP